MPYHYEPTDLDQHETLLRLTQQYVNSAHDAMLRCADLAERFAEADARCRRVVANLSAAPGGGAGTKEDGYAALVDERDKLAREQAHAENRRTEVEQFIDRVDTDSVGKALLRERDVKHKRWEDIQRRLRQQGVWYSVRQLQRLHEKALDRAATQFYKEYFNPKEK